MTDSSKATNLYGKDQNRFYLRTILGQVLIISQPDGKDSTPSDSHNALILNINLLNNDPSARIVAAQVIVQLPTFITASIRGHELNRVLLNTPNFFNAPDSFVNRHQHVIGPVLATLSNELEWDITGIIFNLNYTADEAVEIVNRHNESRFKVPAPHNPSFTPQPGSGWNRTDGIGSEHTSEGSDPFNARTALLSGGTLALV